jgi:hypothetical protein
MSRIIARRTNATTVLVCRSELRASPLGRNDKVMQLGVLDDFELPGAGIGHDLWHPRSLIGSISEQFDDRRKATTRVAQPATYAIAIVDIALGVTGSAGATNPRPGRAGVPSGCGSPSSLAVPQPGRPVRQRCQVSRGKRVSDTPQLAGSAACGAGGRAVCSRKSGVWCGLAGAMNRIAVGRFFWNHSRATGRSSRDSLAF